MTSTSRPERPSGLRSEAGFTLIEVLFAMSVLAIALAALLQTMTAGLANADAGGRSSTAVFLAEERLEQIRSFALSTDPAQGFINVTTAIFPAQAYGAVPGYATYRRTVAITDNPGGLTDTKLVAVTVAWRHTGNEGARSEESVTLSMFLVRR
jgi:prepilin-type N-terminal cleavage/methylation domain-containing protein